MNVVGLADVDDHRLSRLRQALRHGLGFAQFRPIAVAGRRGLRREVGQLDPVEREVALLPGVAPRLDHQREHVPVLVRAARIRFALVPDRTANAIADHRLEHAVVEVAGTMLVLELSALASGFFSISRQRSIRCLVLRIRLEQLAAGSRLRRTIRPSESWIKPMGTPNAWCSVRPKK